MAHSEAPPRVQRLLLLMMGLWLEWCHADFPGLEGDQFARVDPGLKGAFSPLRTACR